MSLHRFISERFLISSFCLWTQETFEIICTNKILHEVSVCKNKIFVCLFFFLAGAFFQRIIKMPAKITTLTLRWTSIPSYATETGMSSGLMDHFVYLFTFTTNDMLIVLISQSALSLTIQHRWSKPLWILRNRRNISISIIVWENIRKKKWRSVS